MKEFTIEEKAKRYDEAIEVARKIKDGEPINVPDGTLVPVAIFPELRESSDEKIRKELIRAFKSFNSIKVWNGIERTDILAWLEKQEMSYTKKDVDDAYLKGISDAKQELEKQGEQNPTDKIEPKFKVGDEIKTANEESLTITKIDEKGYWSNDLFICGFDDAAKWELVKQKPAEWNEEDETMITDLSVIVHTYFSEISGIPFKYDLSEDKIRIWLDSLKDRVQPKQKWSEEDEKTLKSVITNYESGYLPSIDKRDEIIKKLKTLKLKKQWKSSEEQIDVLDKVIRNPHLSTAEYNGLIVLKEQLKAL